MFYSRDCSEKENRLYELFHVKASACEATHNVSWCLHDGQASAGKQEKGEGKSASKERGHLTNTSLLFFSYLKCALSNFLP